MKAKQQPANRLSGHFALSHAPLEHFQIIWLPSELRPTTKEITNRPSPADFVWVITDNNNHKTRKTGSPATNSFGASFDCNCNKCVDVSVIELLPAD